MLASLEQGLHTLSIDLTPTQKQQLLDYLALLHKWNQHTNLTAIRDLNDMLIKHVFDSLTVLRFMQGQRHIDVGTGGGLPGIVLAICLPDQHFTLLDSNGKKCRFLKQANIELGLTNIEIQHTRIEQFHPTHHYDTVLSRAFTELSNMVQHCQHLLNKHGRFLAMKSAMAEHEVSALPPTWQTTVHPIAVPQLPERRILVEILASQPKTD